MPFPPRPMPPAFSPLVELDVEIPLSRASLEQLGVRGLQSGCGVALHDHWLNSDYRALHDGNGQRTYPGRLYRVEKDRYFMQHAVPEPFPIEPESLEWAYSEHFIEHLKLEDGIAWLADMRRLLAPGGLVRVITPDLRKFITGYSDPSDPFFTEYGRSLANRFPDPAAVERSAFMLNQAFYRWGHKWLYDFDELRHAAVAAGFDPEAVEEREFGDGRAPELASLDIPAHASDSLYVEIEKSAICGFSGPESR